MLFDRPAFDDVGGPGDGREGEDGAGEEVLSACISSHPCLKTGAVGSRPEGADTPKWDTAATHTHETENATGFQRDQRTRGGTFGSDQRAQISGTLAGPNRPARFGPGSVMDNAAPTRNWWNKVTNTRYAETPDAETASGWA